MQKWALYITQISSVDSVISTHATDCRPLDLACAIVHARYNSRKGEIRRVEYSAPHVRRPTKNIVCF